MENSSLMWDIARASQMNEGAELPGTVELHVAGTEHSSAASTAALPFEVCCR